MTDNISEKDKKDWENFLLKKEKLPNKDIKIDKKITFKKRSIDLHGYTLDEANKSIDFILKVIFLSIFKSLFGSFSFFDRKLSQSFLSFSEILFVN